MSRILRPSGKVRASGVAKERVIRTRSQRLGYSPCSWKSFLEHSTGQGLDLEGRSPENRQESLLANSLLMYVGKSRAASWE